MTTDNKGAMTGEHCINCGLKVDPKCACSRGRALLVAQPAQAVGKQPVAYLVTDPADDQISHIVRPQELANKLKADGYTIEALVIDPVPAEGAKTWPDRYYVDGKAASPEEFIKRLQERLAALETRSMPPPKRYGAQEEDGDTHETRCAYVDGWNDCRKAVMAIHMPSAAPEPIHASDTVESSWAPNRIWLQREFGDDGSHTWCADSQDEHEQAEYVRVNAPAADAVPVHAATIIEDMRGGRLEWTATGAGLLHGTKLYYLPTAAKGEA